MLAGLAHTYTPRVESALCIGMGVGIVPMELARHGVKTTVVEINPSVVPVAQKFFDFDPSLVELNIADGRYFLNRDSHRYDAIILDVFLGEASPAHLMSREAFHAMHRHLTPNGSLVINAFGETEGRDCYFTGSLDKTLRSVFKNVLIHASGNGNVFFVANDLPERRQYRPLDIARLPTEIQDDAEEAMAGPIVMDPAHGIVLTDDFNPVDYYDARSREETRKNLALQMKNR